MLSSQRQSGEVEMEMNQAYELTQRVKMDKNPAYGRIGHATFFQSYTQQAQDKDYDYVDW